jgi:hypothetical protein
VLGQEKATGKGKTPNRRRVRRVGNTGQRLRAVFMIHEILMVDVDVLRLNEGSKAFTCGILGVFGYMHIS